MRALEKVFGWLAVLLVIVAVVHQVADWRGQAAAAKACTAAVARADTDVAKVCPPAISAGHAVAVRARACDAAFAATPENAYGVQAACSTPVKRVQAERDVARREAGRLTAELQTERLGQDAAIARAQASATTQAERNARAAAAVKAAPRDVDGLVVCDAECVRARWASLPPERP